MRSIKVLVTVFAFLSSLLTAPLASAERIRGVDGRWYELDEKSMQHHNDRRASYGYRSRMVVVAPTSQRHRHVQRRHRHYHAYRNWHDYCRNNWRRDPHC